MPDKTLKPELPEPVRVPSDECAVEIGGKEYHIHRGQSVWVSGARTVGELKATWAFDRLSVKMDAVKGEPDEYAQTLEILEYHFDELLGWMAPRIYAWDWKDATGKEIVPLTDTILANGKNYPCALLDGTARPLEHLSPQEIHYLRTVLRGEVSQEAGNEPNGSAG